MEYQTVSFENNPAEVVIRPFDCIWINLYKFEKERLLESSPLQWIDWKMRGAISRALIEDRIGEGPLFFPTKGRIRAPFVALWGGKDPVPESFAKNCEGQNWKEVLYLCATPSLWASVTKGLSSVTEAKASVLAMKA